MISFLVGKEEITNKLRVIQCDFDQSLLQDQKGLRKWIRESTNIMLKLPILFKIVTENKERA